MYTTFQKFLAEFLGTFALVFFGAGAICADRYLQSSGGIGLLGVALASGLAMAIMVSALGHISGGHFNPAISIGFWVTRRIGTMEAFTYWAAQIIGGIAAAFVLKAIIPQETWRAVALGTPELVRDFSTGAAMLLEAVASFFLVLVFFATSVDERGAFRSIAGFGIGLTVTRRPCDRSLHRRGYESRARFWPRPRLQSLDQLGRLLDRPSRRRRPRRPPLRLALLEKERIASRPVRSS